MIITLALEIEAANTLDAAKQAWEKIHGDDPATVLTVYTGSVQDGLGESHYWDMEDPDRPRRLRSV